jgi:hypothetical protein
MTLRRLLFWKRIGTFAKAYRLAPAKQNLLRSSFWGDKKLEIMRLLTGLRRGYSTSDSSSQSYDAPGRALLQVNISERILPALDRVVCGH